jgi:hypothetical protein
MTEQPVGPRCGNNPSVRLTPGDRKVLDDFRARLALQASAKPYVDSAAWTDGDPLMEVIAATLWKHCAHDDRDMPQLVCDDPRTIAAYAAAVARAAAVTPSADQAAEDLPDRLEAILTARFTELGNPHSEMRRHEQGPDGWPASHPVGPRLVAEVLRELLAVETQTETRTPCSQPNACDGDELCGTHEEEQAHAEGEHEYCGITCETQMPSAPMYNAIVAHGIPGTGGMLDELLRRAAAGLLPTAEERQPAPDVVAFRNPDQPNALWCREHGLRWWGLTPLTSEDLPDGGVCGQCGVDVLIPQNAGVQAVCKCPAELCGCGHHAGVQTDEETSNG